MMVGSRGLALALLSVGAIEGEGAWGGRWAVGGGGFRGWGGLGGKLWPCDISAKLPYADSAWHRARSDIGLRLARSFL